MLHIRRLYYGKLGQLYRERKELRSQVPLARSAGDAAAVEGQSAAENYTALSQLAEQLRINAAEEYSVFLQSFCALWRGVSPAAQACIGSNILSEQRVLLIKVQLHSMLCVFVHVAVVSWSRFVVVCIPQLASHTGACKLNTPVISSAG